MAVFPALLSLPRRGAGYPVADSAGPAGFDRQAVVAFARVAGWCGGLLLASCGLLVAVRRLAGALVAPPGGWAFAALLGGGAVVLAFTMQACRAGTTRAAATLAGCGFATAVLAVGLPADLAGWTASLTPVVAVAAATLALLAPGRGPAATARGRPRPTEPARSGQGRRRSRSRPAPGRLSQRQERYRLMSGEDCIRGRINLELPAGARSGQGYLGFCPAFSELPDVRVETPYDGVEATVAAAEVVPWGVRIECRLAEPAEEPIVIPVLVLATARA